MGLLSRRRTATTPLATSALPELIPSGGVSGDVLQVADLPPEVAAAFGINLSAEYVTRELAMTVPAMKRARSIIAGITGRLPLVAVRAGGAPGSVEQVARVLTEQPDPNTTRQHVLTCTVDSLLFHGIAWWKVLKHDAQGFPERAEWLPQSRVRLDKVLRKVYVDGHEVGDRDVIRFDGPDEGVLKHGGRTLRTCILLEQAVRRFAVLDLPFGYLRSVEGAPELSDPEVIALLNDWTTAVRTRTTPYLNRAVTHESADPLDAEKVQLAGARDYQAVEVARMTNLDPSYVNAPSGDSMTYSNVESKRYELVDISLAPYIEAVQQRLSLDDVTPRGQRVLVDATPFLRGDLKTAIETGKSGVEAGIWTEQEVRTEVIGWPGVAPGRPAAPAVPVPTPEG